VEFKSGQGEAEVAVRIIDDEGWEPDEDFYVELYDRASKNRLIGEDTKTRITILDDDKPGMLVFEEKNALRHPANERECFVVVNRVHGTDGKIKVKYKTVILGHGDQSAKPGRDFEPCEGELEFGHTESKKTISIKILAHEDPDEERDEIFGVKLYEAEPEVVKISKKDTCIVEIVTDSERKKQAEALTQLLERINREENITWGQQFKDATKLHPQKNEDGDIEDVSGVDALLHFLSVGWKVLFACCPPPHWGGGVPCFLAAIAFIGALTAVVGEVASVMGCVMGLKPGLTAITFVAIGTSLPDTFASMTAARESAFADAAVGNVTGSNSVNVFLGLGLPWVIAAIYSR
jgi:solute carrier family 8 (sodium/calcium exchanger)